MLSGLSCHIMIGGDKLMNKNNCFSEKVSNFVTQTKYDDIPEEAINAACLGIADFFGVALAGTREKLFTILLSYIKKMGGSPQASIIGDGYKTSTYQAALVNGAIGHALDYDDWSMAINGHPTVFLAPAILALGEETGASGRDLLTAYVIGFEVCACIPWLIKKNHYDQGWHLTGTLGSIGAAAAASSLLKLNDAQVKVAMGIAASLAAGIRANNGTMTKPLHAGQAAANGIQAVLLAQSGYTARENIFEVERGLIKSFGHNEEVNWTEISEILGRDYFITSPEGLAIKPYPSCGGTHFAIDAVFEIKKNYQFDLDDIVEIELGVNPIADLPLIYRRPKTGLQGKFSLDYTVARALISGHVNLDDFTDERVNQPEVLNLMDKMKWIVKYPMPKQGSASEFDPKSILIKLKDGREIFKEVLVSKGMQENPLTQEEFKEKYFYCASVVLPKEKVIESFTMLSNLKEIEDINELMKTLIK